MYVKLSTKNQCRMLALVELVECREISLILLSSVFSLF